MIGKNSFLILISDNLNVFFFFIFCCLFVISFANRKLLTMNLRAAEREKRMFLSSVGNLMSRLPYSNCIGCNLKENEVI